MVGEGKMTREQLSKEAEAIANEMGHELNLKAVRTLAFFLIKIFKALFRRVYVNEDEVHKVSDMNISEFQTVIFM